MRTQECPLNGHPCTVGMPAWLIQNLRVSAPAGAVLTEVPKRVFPKFSEPRLYNRLPPIILTSEELRSIRITQDPGMFLKPLLSA